MGIYRELLQAGAQAIENDGRWVFNEAAIVADIEDPDKQHRIKVIIPSIDEDLVFDDWVRPLTPFALGDGFGFTFLPEKGAEVAISGVLGQMRNLFYHGAIYNEEVRKAEQLDKDTPGIKVPKNLSFLVALLLKMTARNWQAIIEQLAHLEAENIEAFASALNKMTGQNIESLAEQLNKMTGQTIEQTASGQLTVHGGTVQVNSDGSITIQGGGAITIQGTSIQITGSSIKLFNRTVAPIGPTI